MGFIFVNDKFVEDLKQKINNGTGDYAQVKYELDACAKEFLTQGPWSITYIPSSRTPGKPNDYYSEAPYWWPNPDGPELPYIRKDGDVYPDRFTAHKNTFCLLAHAIISLGSAGYYLDNKEYLDKAVECLKVWFLDEETKMNPHLEYGEAIINICKGRKGGIIVLTCMNSLIHGLGFVEKSGYYPEVIEGMKAWMREMLTWLTTSKIGLEESLSRNNHGAWWNTHVATLSAYIGDDEQFAKCVEFYKHIIVDTQIRNDGLMPHELGRTRSLHYTLYGLDALAMMCELAYQKGIDIWSYESPFGGTLGKAIEVIAEGIDNVFNWPYQQLVGDIPLDEFVLQYAGLRLGLEKPLAVSRKNGTDCYLIKQQTPLGPVCLLEGSALEM